MKYRKHQEKLKRRQQAYDNTSSDQRRRDHMMHRPGSNKK